MIPEFEGRQCILVKSLGGFDCEVTMFERQAETVTQVLKTRGALGKNGVGKTKEGDLKTPLGRFSLSTPFGKCPDPGARMPYRQITETMYWCSTPDSARYNRLIDTREESYSPTAEDEHLIDFIDYYDYALFIDYNREGLPGKGSAIFLHCTGEKPYTFGCVAVPKEVMKEILCRVEENCPIFIEP